MDHADTKNSFNMGFEKPFIRHWIGACGEKVYSLLTGHEIDTWTIGIGDDGTDFSDGAQVKASAIKNMPNLLIPVSQWDRKKAEFYVLIWIQSVKFKRPDSCVMGIVTRQEADACKMFVKKGDRKTYCDTWWIDRNYLKPHKGAL